MLEKSTQTAVVILAAGMGKRMKAKELPKVMALLKSKPLIAHVLDAVQPIRPQKVVVVVGYLRTIVEEFVSIYCSTAEFVIQEQQFGTGHATAQAKNSLQHFSGNVLVLSGDVPLIRPETLQKFLDFHNEKSASISVLTAIAPNPTGYGRIVRDPVGNFIRIVEQKDASESEKTITEINAGIYAVDNKDLFASLEKVNNNNAQNEYYLTDVIEILREQGKKTMAYCIDNFHEILGVNTADELFETEQRLNMALKQEVAQ